MEEANVLVAQILQSLAVASTKSEQSQLAPTAPTQRATALEEKPKPIQVQKKNSKTTKPISASKKAVKKVLSKPVKKVTAKSSAKTAVKSAPKKVTKKK